MAQLFLAYTSFSVEITPPLFKQIEELSELNFSFSLNPMIKLNIHEAKPHLSHYLKNIEAGETILLCRHNVPIAEIRPLPQQHKTPRPLGTAKGKVHVPPEFFEPLPDELLRAFEGQDSCW